MRRQVLILVVLGLYTFLTGFVLGAERAAPPDTDVRWVKPRPGISMSPRKSVPAILRLRHVQRGARYDITVTVVETAEDGTVTPLMDETRTVNVLKPGS